MRGRPGLILPPNRCPLTVRDTGKVNSGAFIEKMVAAGLPRLAVRIFEHYYRKLAQGETGFITERDISPVDILPDSEAFPAELSTIGRQVLPQTVLIKLNGGLGTSMGLHGPKSLLQVRKGHTFLDIAARQSLQARVPLLLMNSFHTRRESLDALRRSPAPDSGLSRDFLQHKVPKVLSADLSPAKWPQDPELEWCPPGHGDLFAALLTSGMLERLLAAGYRYAFVSNIDNLGAVMELKVLGYFIQNDLPFLMEASDRTPVDKKGGHLARGADGRLILREIAQCQPEDMEAFEGIGRHRYFNTNNIWIHLPDLKDLLQKCNGILDLPMIRNEKTLDPRDESSPSVYQLETAMGSAIRVFEGAAAVRVPRSRFLPVKKTAGLLKIRSDRYVMTEEFRIAPNPERSTGDIQIDLDPDFYALIGDLEARFPHGPPSMTHCTSLRIRGDVRFGRDVTLEGEVRLFNMAGRQVKINDGDVLRGERRFL